MSETSETTNFREHVHLCTAFPCAWHSLQFTREECT